MANITGKIKEASRKTMVMFLTIVMTCSSWIGMMPTPAYALSNSITVGAYINPEGGITSNYSSEGIARCVNMEYPAPDEGVVSSTWKYTGEAQEYLTDGDVHALAWAVAQSEFNNLSIQAQQVVIWCCTGANINWDTGYYNKGSYHGNIYSGRGDRLSHSEVSATRSLCESAMSHAGKSGSWDKASRIWFFGGNGVQNLLTLIPTGYLNLKKVSSNASVTDGNCLYSLEDAEYGVYSNASCNEADRVATLITAASGNTNTVELNAGTYYVKELTASEGYNLCTENKDGAGKGIHKVTVISNNTSTITCNESVKPDPIGVILGKYDGEKTYFGEKNLPQGSGKLDGAEFIVEYYETLDYSDYTSLKASGIKAKRAWTFKTDNNGKVSFDTDHFVSGDAFYYNNSSPCIPRGTVVVYESKAPTGYNKSNKILFAKTDGADDSKTIGQFYGNQIGDGSYSNSIKRSDIEFQKDADNTGEQLAKTPFLITTATNDDKGNTVYESHVAVTDENGTFQSSSSWNLHSNNTNANDVSVTITYNGADYTLNGKGRLVDASGNVVADDSWLLDASGKVSSDVTITFDADAIDLEAGIWFGAGTVSDSKGAFYYDDAYYVNEIRTETNKGLSLIEGRKFVISRDGKSIDLGTFDDADPMISTTAYDVSDKDSYVTADTVTVVDEIRAEHLTKDNDYVISGEIHDAETGEAIKDENGNVISVSKPFTATDSSQTVTVEYTFETYDLVGKTLVVYETLKDSHGSILATEEDKTEVSQQVTVLEPKVGTTSVDGADGDKNIVNEPDATVVDTVFYTNLTPNKEYTVTGTLYEKVYDEDGNVTEKKLTIDGKDVTAEAKFTASETGNGETEVTFTFDGTNIKNGTQLVAFESVYDGDREIVAHADINDASQTTTHTTPEIGTTAKDGVDGDKDVIADKDATVVDTVKYTNLTPNKTYKVTGTLYQKVTDKDGKVSEKKLTIDGKDVTAEAEFTASETGNGETEVTFTFDASAIPDGTELVAFESVSYKDTEIAVHADINDESQKVKVKTPKIGTTATDKLDGDKIVVADAETSVTDTIDYENVLIGKQYTMAGILMDAKTGLPILKGEGNEKYTEDDLSDFISVLSAALGFETSYSVKVNGAEKATKVTKTTDGFTYEDESGVTVVLSQNEDGTWKMATTGKNDETVVVTLDKGKVELISAIDTNDVPAYVDMAKLTDVQNKYADLLSYMVYATSEFTPEKELASLDMDYLFNSNDVIDRLAGETKNLVVFEVMFKGSVKDAGKDSTLAIVATECDKDNKGQTVTLIPSTIATTATDKSDGDHKLMAGKDATITDEVTYEGLIPGKEYTLKATLMDKQTGEALSVNDKHVTAELKFTPNSANGTVTIDLGEFDASSLNGHDLVVFEELYKQTTDSKNNTTDVLVAEHKDLDDEGQTVTVTKTPDGGYYGKTGINTTGAAIAIVALLALAGGTTVYGIKNRKATEGASDDASANGTDE